jgi:hypothetical protein
MFISHCQINNYKGFKSSDPISFGPGFNVVVGKNNAGKTALADALSLKFKSIPHRSAQGSLSEPSSIHLKIKLSAEEGFGFVGALNAVSVSAKHPTRVADSIAALRTYLENGVEVEATFGNGTFTNSRVSGVPEVAKHGGYALRVTPGSRDFHQVFNVHPVFSLSNIAQPIFEQFRRRLYFFNAERFGVHRGPIGTDPVLEASARNLPSVLHLLHSHNPARFQRFVRAVRTVFPDIQDVAIRLPSHQEVELTIWFVPPETERADLAIPLSDCGTGIGQVLSMLYVIINSDEARTLLIDEPQSFLHPGAIRKLFEIFKRPENQKHQYIVTTHSPTVVTACSPCKVILLRREGNESKAETIDINETTELRLFLSEIGASLSDVFGADQILWVEGKTEEVCFQDIIKKLLKMELLGTEILAVRSVGDLTGRHKEIVLDIYKNLSRGRGLLPPALGFCFDREGLSEGDMGDLRQESGGLIRFMPRKMYENFLVNPEAIASVLNEADTGKRVDITRDVVAEWLGKNQFDGKYVSESDRGQWLQKMHAAKLLNDLFVDLTETRVRYDKIKHGLKLTNIVIERFPSDFAELGEFLTNLVQAKR